MFENNICSTPLKIKGMIMSGLLVCSAIATSVLTFTTNCENVIQLANNSTMTVNDVGTANKVVSMSLLGFSVVSAIFEQYINKKVIKLELENECLSVELANTKAQTQRSNSTIDIPNEPAEDCNSEKSDITYYPTALKFGQ